MAAGTKLVLGFETSNGSTTTLSFSYAKPTATLAQVKAAMNAITTNGEIFATVPVTSKSAKMVTTTETDYDLDE